MRLSIFVLKTGSDTHVYSNPFPSPFSAPRRPRLMQIRLHVRLPSLCTMTPRAVNFRRALLRVTIIILNPFPSHFPNRFSLFVCAADQCLPRAAELSFPFKDTWSRANICPLTLFAVWYQLAPAVNAFYAIIFYLITTRFSACHTRKCAFLEEKSKVSLLSCLTYLADLGLTPILLPVSSFSTSLSPATLGARWTELNQKQPHARK